MKRKLLSALLCVSMAAALFAGCGDKPAEPTTGTPDASGTPDVASTEVSKPQESGTDEEMLIYLVSKGFQHQYWQAVYQGALEAAAEYGVKMEMVGPPSENGHPRAGTDVK